MADVTLLGIQPENEHGRRFEADARTWGCLARILVAADVGGDGEEAADFFCAKNGAGCDAKHAEFLGDQLEFLVENHEPNALVSATAVTCWEWNDRQSSADFFDCSDFGISLNTIASLHRFLRGSNGFVIESRVAPSAVGIFGSPVAPEKSEKLPF